MVLLQPTADQVKVARLFELLPICFPYLQAALVEESVRTVGWYDVVRSGCAGDGASVLYSGARDRISLARCL